MHASLLGAARAVRAVAEGRSLTDALALEPERSRASVQAIAFYVMRQQARGQALLSLLLDRKAPNRLVESLLVTALCLLSADTQADAAQAQRIPVYEAHTLVDQAVTAAGGDKKAASFKALINACLRRFLRERDALLQAVGQRADVRWGFPKWWIRRIREAYPQGWQAILESAATPGPLTLRVNTRKTDSASLLAMLEQAGIDAVRVGSDGLTLPNPMPVARIPGYEAGLWLVQDAGAQQAAQLLPLRDGQRVLDACAAPGGKTAGLLMQADVHMTALDIDAQRLARVTENLQRLQLLSDRVALARGNAADVDAWWDGQPFDAILADVPCTAAGIVRRHPDIKWLRQEADIAATAALQREIVAALWRTLKPGGLFLYVTCSIFPEEGALQAQWMRDTLPGAVALPAPGQLLPGQGEDHDGFFYAMLRKAT